MRCILHEVHVITEIARHPGRRLATHVGLNPHDEELANSVFLQPCVKVRGAVKRRVHGLRHDQGGLRRSDVGLQRITRVRGCQRRIGILGIMMHNHDWAVGSLPRFQNQCDVVVSFRIVAGAPIVADLKTLLNVDNDEGGIR